MWHSLVTFSHMHLQMSLQEICGKSLRGSKNWWEGGRPWLKRGWNQGISRTQADSTLSSVGEHSSFWRAELQTPPWPHITVLHIQSYVGGRLWLFVLACVQGPILGTMVYSLNKTPIKGEGNPLPSQEEIRLPLLEVRWNDWGDQDTKKPTIVSEANTVLMPR